MRQARYTGVALLATALALLVAFTLGDPGLESDDEPAEFAAEAADAADRLPGIGWALATELSLSVLTVLAGIGLYQLIRRRAPGLALAGSAMLVLFGLFHASQAMVGAAMVSVAREYVAGGLVEAGSNQLLALLKALGAIHFTAWIAAWATLGLAIIAYGRGLSWITRDTPRWLGGLGLGAGVLLGTTPLVLVSEPLFLTWFIGAVLGFAWLLLTAGWLIARPRRTGADPADPAPATEPAWVGDGPPRATG